jgi:hypothetical protein
MTKLIAVLRKIWAWMVKTFTGHAFVLAFPFSVFVVGAIFAQSFLLFMATVVWIFPLILGIHEEEA